MCSMSVEEPMEIQPWIHDASNSFSYADQLRTVSIPDVSPSDMVSEQCEFSMVAGEFLETYSPQVDVWDGLVTCFFLDTAPNVIDYIEAIYRMLKPGGVWINLGPLTYHWKQGSGSGDSRYDMSIELPHEDILKVIESYGMKVVKNERRECSYTRNVKSMLRSVYTCSFFTVIKPQV